MVRTKFFFFFLLIIIGGQDYAEGWQTLRPGLEYRDLNEGGQLFWSHIHVFRIQPSAYRLQVAQSSVTGGVRINDLAEQHHALLAVNGGFFTSAFKSLGLRISDGKVLTPLHKTSWFGIFYIQDKQAHIVSKQEFTLNPAVQTAIQSGPRLIVDGQIPPLKPGIAERTALGIDRQHALLILVTENLPMTTNALASLMQKSAQEGGLDCWNALNLDGGSSTQLYAKIGNFERHVAGYNNIADGLLITL